MRLRYLRQAVADLDDIRSYIEKDNASAAWVVASFIRRSITVLEDWPYSGRATEREGIRRHVVMNYPYVVYYRVDGKQVTILRIMHSTRRQ